MRKTFLITLKYIFMIMRIFPKRFQNLMKSFFGLPMVNKNTNELLYNIKKPRC